MWYELPSEWEIAGSVVAGSFGAQKKSSFQRKTYFFTDKIRATCPDVFFLPYKVFL